MKAVTGAVAALLTIVLVFVGFGLRGGSSADARQAGQVAYAQPVNGMQPVNGVQPVNGFAGAQVVPVNAVQNDAGWQQAAAAGQQPVLVNCGPGTQTLVRPVWVNGQQVSQVDCVTAPGVVYPQQQVRTVAYDAPVYDARMTRPQVVYRDAPAPRRVTRSSGRSWTKTALVIGGSTAGGAGIGGILGGKKGALIGAAIGGGASTIYEAAKRR